MSFSNSRNFSWISEIHKETKKKDTVKRDYPSNYRKFVLGSNTDRKVIRRFLNKLFSFVFVRVCVQFKSSKKNEICVVEESRNNERIGEKRVFSSVTDRKTSSR